MNQLGETRSSTLKGVEREHTNLAAIIAENLYQVLDQKQAIELLAQGWLKNRRQDPLNEISNFIYSEQAFNRVAFYAPSGQQLYQSSPSMQTEPQAAVIGKKLTSLVAGDKTLELAPELKNVAAGWQVPLLFSLQSGQQIVGGMLLELDLGYILNLFQNIDIGRTGSIGIFLQDGSELARFENGGLVVGGGDAVVLAAAANDFQGARIFDFQNSNGRFHAVFQPVERYPFIVTVSQGYDEVLGDFSEHRREQLWILAGLSLLGLLGLHQLLRALKRKQQYLSSLAESDADKSKLIEKLEQEHQNAVNAASFDALTGLYNRRLFVSLGQQNLLLAKRNNFCYGLLFIDLDRFKKINDNLGHRIGDLLLQEVATRLLGCLRESDIISRFGGDEFVVMLTEMASEQVIHPIAEKVNRVITGPCELDGHKLSVSPSIGIAVYPRDGGDVETLLRNADAAMYNSKRAGRGRFSFFDSSLNPASIAQFELEQGLPQALANDELVLHYQPKVRLQDSRVVGLEALIRWQHPQHNLLYPNDFIDQVEESGLMADLGRWVLKTACRQQVSWRKSGVRVVPVAVNVSPIELRDPQYAENFFAVLDEYSLLPSDIEVEITESAIIQDTNILKDNLQALSADGVRIYLDDFGNGYSSLSHIRSLPISTLKIDRSFIQDIRKSHNDNAIVNSTISLAQKLKLTVVAEGIETEDQLRHLKLAGCDQVQGYLFSRPVAEDKIIEFLVSPIRSVS